VVPIPHELAWAKWQKLAGRIKVSLKKQSRRLNASHHLCWDERGLDVCSSYPMHLEFFHRR